MQGSPSSSMDHLVEIASVQRRRYHNVRRNAIIPNRSVDPSSWRLHHHLTETEPARSLGSQADIGRSIPAPLPPSPPVEYDSELLRLLSEADVALGRLDGAVGFIPDPDLFVGMYVRREAVLSSQIEGTQSTLEDLLEVELDPRSCETPTRTSRTS